MSHNQNPGPTINSCGRLPNSPHGSGITTSLLPGFDYDSCGFYQHARVALNLADLGNLRKPDVDSRRPRPRCEVARRERP